MVVQRFARCRTNLGNQRISQDICCVRMTDNNDFVTINGQRANLLNKNFSSHDIIIVVYQFTSFLNKIHYS